MYVNPATATVFDQGLIVDEIYFYAIDELRPGLILTPTCDFANAKCDYIHACPVFPAREIIELLVQDEWRKTFSDGATGQILSGPLSTNKKREFADRVGKIITQKQPRLHWLAPWPGHTDPHILDFQIVESISVVDLPAPSVLAQLTSPYREQVAARYASYMGRVGVDEFDEKHAAAWVEALEKSTFP